MGQHRCTDSVAEKGAKRMNTLFNQPLKVVNAGLHSFADNIQHAGGSAIALNWQPPAQGDIDAGLDLASLLRHPLVENANQIAMARYLEAQPVLVDVMLAKEAIPAMAEQKRILHSGPPIAWEEMCGPVKGAIIGAMLYEGWATSQQDAENQINAGEIDLAPCHHYHAVGPMAGIISPSMPLWVVENKTNGHRTFSNFNEGLGKVLRFGANNDEVLNRLAWMRDELAPAMKAAIAQHGELELKPLMAQALHMGDECHNRNNAGTTLLIQALTPGIIQAGYSVEQQREVFEFVASSDYFSGPTWMAMCKAAMDAAHGIEYSTVVTTMARNGVEFGLRVSGLPGQWFTGPAQQVIGPMFAGYKPEDSGLDIGDSAITETYGIGGFAMATAPAIVALVGGTVEEAIDFSRQMREITLGENPNVTIPLLGFMGVPSAIDITRVGSSGILPVINTAIAHKDAGVGMIGAGIVHPPFACFEKAILGWCERYGV